MRLFITGGLLLLLGFGAGVAYADYQRVAGVAVERAREQTPAIVVPNDFLRRKGDTNKRLVSLTFDDGPDPRFTPRILTILERNHIRATFFVVGESAQKYPSILRRMQRDGDTVGNHTWDHPELELLPASQMRIELTRAAKEIETIIGKKPKFFRPPHGVVTPAIDMVAQSLGYKTVLWSNAIVERWPPNFEARLLSKLARPGAIILSHDGRLNRERELKVLPLLIRGLKRRGFRFITLDEMPTP